MPSKGWEGPEGPRRPGTLGHGEQRATRELWFKKLGKPSVGKGVGLQEGYQLLERTQINRIGLFGW